MQVRQLFDSSTSTYTYLLFDQQSRDAAIIDSVKEQFERDSRYIQELGLNLKFALETHVHADHITAAGQHREAFGAKVAIFEPTVKCADHHIQDGDVFQLGSDVIQAIHTPGHTNGDVSFLIDGAVFTGDALLIRACGRTDFQQGDSDTLYHSIADKLFCLPEQTVIYPGHDYSGFTSSTIGEERALNPRIGGKQQKSDFTAIMDNMNLPKPKRIDVALPGNLGCGL